MPMSFITSFSIELIKQEPFPYNIPAVQFARDIELDPRVTLFVGDNGCGKSTLLESLGLALNIPLIGGFATGREGFEAANLLKDFVKIKWKNTTSRGFFFRAEDFSDFIRGLERENDKNRGMLRELGELNESVIKEMSEGMNKSLQYMRREYGDDMQAYSHGEAYLKILQTRIKEKGIYILDEPEASLSPLRQLSLIAFIMDVLKDNKAQFVIATHSPILMGIPGSTIYQISEEGFEKVGFEGTDHYRITKQFLDDPEYYLRHMR